jgi:cobalamin biosynthesis protein CobD/CbiB
MYDLRPNLVIGFHGCDIRVRDKLLSHPNEIVISQKPYEWLGHAMYFWENNYARAMQWTEDKKRRGAIETPAVIGAVLFLGYCCDLSDSKCIGNLTAAYARHIH